MPETDWDAALRTMETEMVASNVYVDEEAITLKVRIPRNDTNDALLSVTMMAYVRCGHTLDPVTRKADDHRALRDHLLMTCLLGTAGTVAEYHKRGDG